jgi:hypothetical protein
VTAALHARSRIRLQPAPVVDPPYDDEPPAAARGLWLVPSQLPFEEVRDEGRRQATEPSPQAASRMPPPPQPGTRQAPRRPTPRPPVPPPAALPRPTPRSALPAPRAAATALVQAVLEILAGRRPLQQVRTLTSEEVYDELHDRLAALSELRKRRGARPGTAARLQSVHVDEPTDGVAEVTAVIRAGERRRAVALRLEGVEGRWNCTALHLL